MGKSINKEQIKAFGRVISPYKKEIALLSILGIVSAFANAAVPFFGGRVIDALVSPREVSLASQFAMPAVIYFLSLWFLVAAVDGLISWRSGLRGALLNSRIYNEYMANGFSRIVRLPISFFANERSGAVMDKIQRASNGVASIAGDTLIFLAPEFLGIIAALTISFFVNSTLSLIMILGLLIYLYLLVVLSAPTAQLSLKMHKSYNKAFGNVYEAAGNIKPIKQISAERQEEKRIYSDFVAKAGGYQNSLDRIWQLLSYCQRVIVLLTQFAIFFVSILFIRQGVITVGELVMFNGYSAMFFGPFVRLGRSWQRVQNGLNSISQAEEILNHPPEVYQPKNAVTVSSLRGEIEFKGVGFGYKDKKQQVLSDINFSTKEGEVVALVGDSGAGKSTLIDLISGYYFAQKGEVLIDGVDVRSYDLSLLRSQIGVVPQEVVLFNDSILKNLKYGLGSISNDAVKRAAKMAHAHEFIEKFPDGYKQVVGERGIKLSVGQKQRVAIARAILRDPKILILDEPTSALDAKSEKFIQDSLNELMRGRTTFVIAHRLSTVRHADIILVIKDGKIVERGKHEELVEKKGGEYRHLYELQVGLHG
ncbi:MAG: ABC transporter ATP-binding protein [Candidatus Paceibacterota bacterium]